MERINVVENPTGPGVALKAAALQFVLAHPAVASVIPGPGSLAELEENVEMVRASIPSDFWEELRHEELIPEEAPVPPSQSAPHRG